MQFEPVDPVCTHLSQGSFDSPQSAGRCLGGLPQSCSGLVRTVTLENILLHLIVDLTGL